MPHPPTPSISVRSAATARTTLALTGALVIVVAVARLTPLPESLSVVGWPALGAAFFIDTLAYNEAGIRVGDAGFWSLFVVGCYLEAIGLVVVTRAVLARR